MYSRFYPQTTKKAFHTSTEVRKAWMYSLSELYAHLITSGHPMQSNSNNKV